MTAGSTARATLCFSRAARHAASRSRGAAVPFASPSSSPLLGGRRRAGVVVRAGLCEKLNAEQLEQAIQERDRPMIIDFYATWCGPCVLLSAELEKVAADLGNKVRIVKVDTDEEQELASQLQIQGLPTIVFLSMDPKKPALRTEGLLPCDVIKEIIEKEL